MTHRTQPELEAGLDDIRQSPRDDGTLVLIVSRPAEGERQILAEAVLDAAVGLVGDSWYSRPGFGTPDKRPNTAAQLTLMNSRAAALVAVDPERWPLAGDQLYVDLDLSGSTLPPGTRLQIGTAVIEVTAEPHTGCAKFRARFGADAMKFVNSEVGRAMNLRGINARVVTSGSIRAGDTIRRREESPSSA